MTGPPAVAWNIGPSRALRVFGGAVLLLGSLSSGFYLHLQDWGSNSIVVILLWTVGAASAVCGLKYQGQGALVWDGQHWHWREAGNGGNGVLRLSCPLDFQRWMLLHVGLESGKSVWLWAESRDMHPHWLAFRRAVFSHQVNPDHDANMLM